MELWKNLHNSLGLDEMARCIRWQHLRRFECVFFALLWPCPCMSCLPCSSNMTARKGRQGAVGSRRGLLQQCNTKYYKQAELAKSSAKLLPNSSIRSKQGILLFLLHVCGNPASRNSHPSLPCHALLVKSNLLHTFVRRSKTATKCIRPARQLQL